MRIIKLGRKVGGFVRANCIAYVYFKSETIFFRAYQRERGVFWPYWFNQPLERFTQAIVHESTHILLVRLFGPTVSKQLDNLLGDVRQL